MTRERIESTTTHPSCPSTPGNAPFARCLPHSPSAPPTPAGTLFAQTKTGKNLRFPGSGVRKCFNRLSLYVWDAIYTSIFKEVHSDRESIALPVARSIKPTPISLLFRQDLISFTSVIHWASDRIRLGGLVSFVDRLIGESNAQCWIDWRWTQPPPPSLTSENTTNLDCPNFLPSFFIRAFDIFRLSSLFSPCISIDKDIDDLWRRNTTNPLRNREVPFYIAEVS